MEPAPLTAANERQRLALLRDLALIDRPSDRVFQDLTVLCAQLFDVPFAMVCFLDDQQVHCRATVGCGPMAMPRSESFCQYLQDRNLPLQVEDARNDERFARLPMVKGGSRHPFLRRRATAHGRRPDAGQPDPIRHRSTRRAVA
ncbi:hypothetical protein QE440_004077 [Pseudomonas psychrotolerans]|uniref:GAF domain-containing protein n=1 Tax=Pseudomonas oryzihabitans TaxID=47885 RepID=A0AAJ2EZ75_9PSED|nr:hypothetical protein [Pseudomonas psychrotolerans]